MALPTPAHPFPVPSPLVLIVEAERHLGELIARNLEREGFRTATAADGREALEKAHQAPPDLIILDVVARRSDGLDVCRRIRRDGHLYDVPVLMLAARTDEADVVRGLDAGADVYLGKPVSIPIILSQARALLRGTGRAETGAPRQLRVHDLEIDRDRYLVYRHRDGRRTRVELPRKEFELLFHLASTPGRVFSRQDLLEEVWRSSSDVGPRTIDVHVRKLREKLGSRCIETVKGVGYRLRP